MPDPLVVYYSSTNNEVIHSSDTFPITYNNGTILENVNIGFHSWLGEWYGALYEQPPRDHGGQPLIGGSESDVPPYSSAASATAQIARPFFDNRGAAESQGYLALHFYLDRNSFDTDIPAGVLKVYYYNSAGLRRDISIYIPALTLTNDNPLIILYPSQGGSTFYDKNLKVLARQNPAEDIGDAAELYSAQLGGKVNYYHSMDVTDNELTDDAEFLEDKITDFIVDQSVNGVVASPGSFTGLEPSLSGSTVTIQPGIAYAGGHRIEVESSTTVDVSSVSTTQLIVIEHSEIETDSEVDASSDRTIYTRKQDSYTVSLLDPTMKQTYQLAIAEVAAGPALTDIRSFVPRIYNVGNEAYLTIVKDISGTYKMLRFYIRDVGGQPVVSVIEVT
jgi:hypothetical protein